MSMDDTYKKIAIVTDCNIFNSNGVNYVTSTFVEGKEFFKKRGYQLNSIYYDSGILDCSRIEKLPQFDEKLKSYVLSPRKINFFIKVLKKISKYDNLIIELLRNYLITYRRAKRTIDLFYKNGGFDNDIVIFQGYLPAYVAYKYYKNKIKFKSIVLNHTGEDSLDQDFFNNPSIAKNNYWRERAYSIIKYATLSTDYLVVLSEVAKKSFYWLDESHKTIIFNGIVDLYIDNRERSDQLLQFVSVASLNKRKGQHLLITALSYLPPLYLDKIHLNIVGQGDCYQELIALTKKLNLDKKVTFWGRRVDVPYVLSQMDIFILASYGEGLPISIIEALRQGLFVMTSGVGGCPDMIDENTGVLMALQPQKIAESIMAVMDSRIYENARQYSRERYLTYFTLPIMVSNYCNLFDEILE